MTGRRRLHLGARSLQVGAAVAPLAGNRDASLDFVMAGPALTVFNGYRLVWRRSAALFGIGWGIGGFCLGPAWAALPLMAPDTPVFLPAMLTGLWLGTRLKTVDAFTTKGATP